jgi:hypothetical protein
MEINEEVIKLIQTKELQHHTEEQMANPSLDKFNPPAKYEDGTINILYKMFVDDALSACLHDNNTIKQMVCTSVESLYIFLGYPDSIENPKKPAAIAIKKFLDRPLGEKRISLGT